MRNFDDLSDYTLSGVPLDSLHYLRKIVNPCNAQQTQEPQSSTYNADGYMSKFHEPDSITSTSLRMTLTTEALSSDVIATLGLETTLREHTNMDTRHFNFILKEPKSEPPFFPLTYDNVDCNESFSPCHGVGLLGIDISDLDINPVAKASTDMKGKAEDAYFSVFAPCIGLTEEEDSEYYHYHYHFQQDSSSQLFSLEELAFPSFFTELALESDHTPGAKSVAYEFKDYGKEGSTTCLVRNTGLVSHYARALQHMEPIWMPALEVHEDQRMARLSDSTSLSLERRNKAALWTIETMLCG